MIETIITVAGGYGIYKYLSNRYSWSKYYKKIIENKYLIQNSITAYKSYSDFSSYFNYNKLHIWQKDYSDIIKLIKNAGDKIKELGKDDKLIKDFFLIINNDNTFRTDYNNKYIKKKMVELAPYFDKQNPKPTYEQKKAIIIDEDINFVNAGAGTGKTYTIINKIKYLIDKQLIKQSDVLAIAYNKKAAEELRNRLSNYGLESVESKTFHSHAIGIIRKYKGKSPEVFGESRRDLLKLLNKLIEKELGQTKFLYDFTKFFTFYSKPYLPFNEFKNVQEYKSYLKTNLPLTIKGEQVKSQEEVFIANLLFIYNIEYVYEKDYEVVTKSKQHRQYKPDFFLTDYGIYIEHFALNRDGKSVFGEKYEEEYQWKLKQHEINNTKMICTYSYQIWDKTLAKNLKSDLIKFDVKIKNVSKKTILKKLRDTSNFEIIQFTGLIETFLNLYKTKNLDINGLKSKINNIFNDNHARDRAKTFINIFKIIYNKYQAFLTKNKKIDFHDMISLGIEFLQKNNELLNYKYIIIDEFQDISESRYQLVLSTIERCHNAKLFVVGDDWQSIYKFAGSDLGILLNFKDYFGKNYSTSELTNTFRFGKELADISNKFIMRNDSQIKKEIKSVPYNITPIYFQEKFRQKNVDEINRILQKLVNKAKQREKKISVLILNRYRKGRVEKYFDLINKYLKNKYLNLKVETIHTSKGLTFDYVIIDDVTTGKMGFPSNITDDKILLLVSETDLYENSEERRLFYVALTRAKKSVFLLYTVNWESKFILELKEILGILKYCEKCETEMRVKTNQQDQTNFFGCQNYPNCRETINIEDEDFENINKYDATNFYA